MSNTRSAPPRDELTVDMATQPRTRSRFPFLVGLLVRLALLLVILLIGLSLAAPFVQIEGLGDPMRKALERGLNRRVQLGGPVHPRVFPSPGLTIESVVIYEEPEISLEPIAYVDSLEASLNPLALLMGRFDISTLTLVRPSVNLAKSKAGAWNYPPLLDRAFSASPSDGRPPLPRIEVRDARMNFRFGDTKSVFYLSGADVDIEPVTEGEPALGFRFAGAPSRTDRAAQGFGNLSGNGRFVYTAGGENHISLVIRLERSAIPDLVTLVHGHGAGLGGFVASRAELQGPLSAVRIKGELELAEIDRRFQLLARTGEWSVNYVGSIDLTRQQMRLRTRPAGQDLPVSVRLFLADYLSQPQWSAVLTAERLPLETLPVLAAEMGNPIFPGLALHGFLSGAVGRAREGGMQGHFRASEIRIRAPDGETLDVEQADITASGDLLRVAPCTVTVGDEAVATVRGEYSRGDARLEIGIQARELSVPRSREVWMAMTGSAPPPALDDWTTGQWSGDLRYVSLDKEDTWTGRLTVSDTSRNYEGLSEPVQIAALRTDVAGRSVTIDGSAGGLEFQAAHRPGKPIEISVSSLDAFVLEDLLAPALRWRRPGIIARTLRLRPPPVPIWLADRNLQVHLTADQLDAGAVRLEDLDARVYWNGPHLEIHASHANANPGSVRGRIDADLSEGSPRYRLALQAHGLQWDGGVVDAEGRLRAEGIGLELLTRVQAEGSFTFRNPSPAASFRRAAGCYEFSVEKGLPILSFPCLTLQANRTKYHGWGEASVTSGIDLELFDSEGSYTGSGTLNPLTLEIKPVEPAAVE